MFKWIACLCCGFLTIDERGGYEICPVCGWEDDPVQARDASYRGGANDCSLNEAKVNYTEFGAASRQMVKQVRPPLPDEIPRDGGCPEWHSQ